MALSIEEQITALEEELSNTKGPGSKAKKEEIKEQIKDLTEQFEEQQKAKQKVIDERFKGVPPGIASEDIPVLDMRPMPTKWVKVTLEQVQKAEKEGKLVGFDNVKMMALLRN